MATHSGTFVWRVPWTEGRDRPQSTESQRVGHNCATDFHFHVQGLSQPLLVHRSLHICCFAEVTWPGVHRMPVADFPAPDLLEQPLRWWEAGIPSRSWGLTEGKPGTVIRETWLPPAAFLVLSQPSHEHPHLFMEGSGRSQKVTPGTPPYFSFYHIKGLPWWC